MGGGFSSEKKKKPTTTKKAEIAKSSISSIDRAVLDLKNTRDRLSKYKKRLELDEGKLIGRAKQAKTNGQTKIALHLLRLRKIKVKEVETVEAQLLNIFQMVQTIDSKQNETQVLAAMTKGKDALQKMHEETTVDDVLELMDTISEQNEVEQEISNILQGVPSTLSVDDEAAVEAELEALMQQEGLATTTTTTADPTTTTLPTVPTNQPVPEVPTHKLPEAAPAATGAAETDGGRVAVAS